MIDVRGIHASLRIYTHLFRANQIDSSFLFLSLFFLLPVFFIFISISFFPLLFFFFVFFVWFLVRLFLFELDDFSLVGYPAARTICRRWYRRRRTLSLLIATSREWRWYPRPVTNRHSYQPLLLLAKHDRTSLQRCQRCLKLVVRFLKKRKKRNTIPSATATLLTDFFDRVETFFFS